MCIAMSSAQVTGIPDKAATMCHYYTEEPGNPVTATPSVSAMETSSSGAEYVVIASASTTTGTASTKITMSASRFMARVEVLVDCLNHVLNVFLVDTSNDRTVQSFLLIIYCVTVCKLLLVLNGNGVDLILCKQPHIATQRQCVVSSLVSCMFI